VNLDFQPWQQSSRRREKDCCLPKKNFGYVCPNDGPEFKRFAELVKHKFRTELLNYCSCNGDYNNIKKLFNSSTRATILGSPVIFVLGTNITGDPNWDAGGEKPPNKIFRPPWKNVFDIVKNYWTWFKNFGPSQKTLRPAWCPKLVTGLLKSYCIFKNKHIFLPKNVGDTQGSYTQNGKIPCKSQVWATEVNYELRASTQRVLSANSIVGRRYEACSYMQNGAGDLMHNFVFKC